MSEYIFMCSRQHLVETLARGNFPPRPTFLLKIGRWAHTFGWPLLRLRIPLRAWHHKDAASFPPPHNLSPPFTPIGCRASLGMTIWFLLLSF